MKRFLFRISLFGIPFLFLFLTYFILDPFRVLYNYEDYSKDLFVQINRDFVSTETFLKNRSKYQFNSFIFGSSRTLAYKTWEWKKWLPDNAVPFCFDASNENLFGIWSKIKYIDNLGDKISNALIVICSDVTFVSNTDYDSYLYIKDPRISRNCPGRFKFEFLKAFFSNRFYVRYIDYSIFHQYRNYMFGYIGRTKINYEPIFNDCYLMNLDEELKADPEAYYLKYAYYFRRNNTNQPCLTPMIDEKSQNMLADIANIFVKHGTNFKIIISPLYDQKKFNETDLLSLKNIFGSSNVFDFSGMNKYTSDFHNFYESSHYRPFVGAQLLKCVYSN